MEDKECISQYCWSCAVECPDDCDYVFWHEHKMTLCSECYEWVMEDIYTLSGCVWDRNERR